jgi:hypothetical protein
VTVIYKNKERHGSFTPRLAFYDASVPAGCTPPVAVAEIESVSPPAWLPSCCSRAREKRPHRLSTPAGGAKAAEDRRREGAGVGLRAQLQPGNPLHPLEAPPPRGHQARRRPVSV